jgi:hypothetical protein
MPMPLLFRTSVVIIGLTTLLAVPRETRAQHEGHAGMAGMAMDDSIAMPSWHFMVQAIPLVTHAAHTAGAVNLTEGYLSQDVVMTHGQWWNGHGQLDATFNGEGLTMRRGELSTGGFGEGYVDRRHPHAYVHEVVVTGDGSLGRLAYSASLGRGFAPFGTDDPMMRPFEKYPINHHLSQILERAVGVGAVRVGPAILEGALFNGDEPSSPGAMPTLRRFGDSWSVRATALPVAGLEVQGSYARVASPEETGGFGLDQRKRSVSARFISSDGGRYLLSEWARTIERDHSRHEDFFAYESVLAEGAMTVGAVGMALRFEQTERPEEERLANPFRTPRPASDLAINGTTQWRAMTLALTLPSVTHGAIRGYPFVELERLTAASRDLPTVFVPDRFYGSHSPWMLSAGVRVRYGPLHARMGRYGVALPDGAPIRTLGTTGGNSIGPHTH